MATTSDQPRLVPLIQTSSSPPIPIYLIPLMEFLFGLTALSQSTPVTIFAVSFGIYSLVTLAASKPQGQPYLHVFTAGCMLFSAVARTISAAWLMDEKEFRRREADKNDEKEEDNSEERSAGKDKRRRPWWQWIVDVFDLGFMCRRGVGWNFQHRNLPPAPAKNTLRMPFAAKHIASAILNLLLVDLSHHFHRHFSSITSTPVKPLMSQSWPLALLNAWLIYLQARWTMSAAHSLLAAITVPLNIYPPSSFPPLFGSFAHAYTVRRFWSHTWHQMMRNVALPYTRLLVRVLQLDQRNKSTYWVKVCSAFFWAWAVHAYGTFIAGGGVTADLYRYFPQVFAFWVEEKVVEVARKRGFKGGKWRVLGYLWVFVFQGFTLVSWFGPAVHRGGYLVHPLGFSVVDKMGFWYD